MNTHSTNKQETFPMILVFYQQRLPVIVIFKCIEVYLILNRLWLVEDFSSMCFLSTIETTETHFYDPQRQQLPKQKARNPISPNVTESPSSVDKKTTCAFSNTACKPQTHTIVKSIVAQFNDRLVIQVRVAVVFVIHIKVQPLSSFSSQNTKTQCRKKRVLKKSKWTWQYTRISDDDWMM